MKANRNKMTASDKFCKNMEETMKQYYHRVTSYNAKRAWKLRKERLSTEKVAV